MTLRTICLGNPNPKAYCSNPPPPLGATLAQVRAHADACGVDTARCLKAGDEVRASDGTLIYVAGEEHERASLGDAIAAPVLIPYHGPKCCTTIKFSPDSTLVQAVSEAKTIWSAHGNGTPAWIAGDNAVLVAVLAESFGITEVRDLEIAE